MVLIAVDKENNSVWEKGLPYFMAKLAPGGKVLKAVQGCRPAGTIDFSNECRHWDPTMSNSTYSTTRDLANPNWPVQLDNNSNISEE